MMTEKECLAFDLLSAFRFAALQRVGPREYIFFGKPPAFYDDFFPPVGGQPCDTPWEMSPMLDFFLEDAEKFFASGQEGMIFSGAWEEEGKTEKDTALIAIAVQLGNAQMLVVRQLREDYAERTTIMRSARVQLLENRELSNSLAIFKEKSRIDGLTRIFNRGTFSDLLQDEIKRSQILRYPLTLLILDIDDFKKVNDTYGHLTGDRVLQGLGETLKASLRRNDIVARYGGEEFAVLLANENFDQAVIIAEKIRNNIAMMEIHDTPRITVSIGCTAYLTDEPTEAFIKRADEALYEAKRSGKNRVCTRY